MSILPIAQLTRARAIPRGAVVVAPLASERALVGAAVGATGRESGGGRSRMAREATNAARGAARGTTSRRGRIGRRAVEKGWENTFIGIGGASALGPDGFVDGGAGVAGAEVDGDEHFGAGAELGHGDVLAVRTHQSHGFCVLE